MIILTSNGLSSDALRREAGKYTATARKAAIVTTASVGYKENDWHIPRITQELEQLGLSVDYVDIEAQSPDALLGYDVVEINGGNPFFLLHQIRLQKAEDIFRCIAEKGVLIGISAGSCMLQKNIDLIAQYSPEMNQAVGLNDHSALGLTRLEILPHYHRFLSRFEKFEERAQAYEQAHDCAVIRLDDGQGVFDMGDRYYTV